MIWYFVGDWSDATREAIEKKTETTFASPSRFDVDKEKIKAIVKCCSLTYNQKKRDFKNESLSF